MALAWFQLPSASADGLRRGYICIGFSQISSWKALFDYLILIGLKPLKEEGSTIRRLKPTAIETRLKPFRESVRGSVKMKSALTVFRSLKTASA